MHVCAFNATVEAGRSPQMTAGSCSTADDFPELLHSSKDFCVCQSNEFVIQKLIFFRQTVTVKAFGYNQFPNECNCGV